MIKATSKNTGMAMIKPVSINAHEDRFSPNRFSKKEAKDSVTFAEESPFPDVSAITEDVYYEVDEGTESGKRGKHFFHN